MPPPLGSEKIGVAPGHVRHRRERRPGISSPSIPTATIIRIAHLRRRGAWGSITPLDVPGVGARRDTSLLLSVPVWSQHHLRDRPQPRGRAPAPEDHDGRKWKFVSRLPTDKLGVYTLYTATIMASEEFHIFKRDRSLKRDTRPEVRRVAKRRGAKVYFFTSASRISFR